MKNVDSFAWTEQRIDRLKARWAEGASAALIAAEFGAGVSRSAVVGKVRRLNLKPRKKKFVASTARGQNPVDVVQPKTANRGGMSFKIGKARQAGLQGAEAMAAVLGRPEPVVGLGDAVPAARGLVQLEDLSRDNCRWPFGDPLTPDFGFCGHRVAAGEVYCPIHCRKAYPGWTR